MSPGWPKQLALLAGGLVAAAIVLPASVMAATATSSIAVSATVSASCQIAANPLAFGSYSGSEVDATATLNVTCTNTTPYNVGLDAGQGSGATTTTRIMKGTTSSANTLNYTLWQDSAHSTNWGNSAGTDTKSGTGSGTQQSLTVYGVIPASQNAVPDSYTDSVVATVTY